MTNNVAVMNLPDFDVENCTEEQAVELVCKDFRYLSLIKNQTNAVCMAGLAKSAMAIMYIDNKTDELIMEAIDKSPVTVVSNMPNLSDELFLYAYERNLSVIGYRTERSRELNLKMLAIDGHGLQFMDCDDMDLCETAVKTTPNAIRYCNNITGIMAQTAMQGDVRNIIYVVDKLKDEGWIRYLVEKIPIMHQASEVS